MGKHADPETKTEEDTAEENNRGSNSLITAYANDGSAKDSPTTSTCSELHLTARDRLGTGTPVHTADDPSFLPTV